MKTVQRLHHILFLTVGLLVISNDWAFGQSADDRISRTSGGNERELSIDVNPRDPNNQVVIGHAPEIPLRFKFINTFVSIDKGESWKKVTLSKAHDKQRGTFRFDPTVAFDGNGNVYVAYGVSDGENTTVVVCKSTNGGFKYKQCTPVDTHPDNDKWHLATGSDPFNSAQQNVYIVWNRVPGRVLLSRSTDAGKTFSAPIVVSDAPVPTAASSDPAVGPRGEVYVAWIDAGTGNIFVDISFNGGRTFGTDNLVTTINPGFINPFGFIGFKVPIPAQPHRGVHAGPTIDVDRSGGPFNGRLYITYVDLELGGVLPDTDIFVQFSDDLGRTWSARTRANDRRTNSQFLPWLDVDQQSGVVGVAWYDARNDLANKKVEVFLAVSRDGGASFLPNIPISDGQSDRSVLTFKDFGNDYLEYIGLAMFNCEAFPVWADNSRDINNMDLYTDQVIVTPCP
ncbi:hypothetical protein [Candidatus Methylomirabilis sp.]|uniref:sialidase family protein n=1 Tax=Candidatus Methylomirabilis sp. TaxID=2032687 RepID=UPI003C766B88